MNDRSVNNLLEQYDVTIKGISKGRGTLICDTDKGTYVLKEYKGRTDKLELLNSLQERLSDNLRTERLIKTKEGCLFAKDTDNLVYILTSRVEGRECSYKSQEDIVKACSAMARMHLRFMTNATQEACGEAVGYEMPVFFYADEMERHTNECRHVRNYLRKKGSKTDFERRLLKEYDYFLERAVDVTRRALEESKAEYVAYVRSNSLYCHGDYQYHNVLFGKDWETGIVNLEHFAHEAGVRDFYLFFRKVCQKYDWSFDVAESMLDAYQGRRAFPPMEMRSLKLRLEYPEKFWKIVNFYYNSRKSWMPDSNSEKLEKLIHQEKNKERLMNRMFS